MKRMVFGMLLVSSLAWASEEKVSYLPPYEPHSSVSPKVQEFLEASKSLDLGQTQGNVFAKADFPDLNYVVDFWRI